MYIKKLSSGKVWNNHIADIWYNIFLFCNFNKDSVIVEIAPGEVNKIGLGLSKYNFSGTLYVVEPHVKSLKKIIRKYKRCLPNAEIIPLEFTIEDVVSHLPNNVDAILSNHPLDDMIISRAIDEKKVENFFTDHYSSLPTQTRNAWNKLESSKKNMRDIKQEVFLDWKNIIEKINPSFVIIAQYESYYFKKNNIFAPDKHAFNILNKIRKYYSISEMSVKNKINSLVEYDKWLLLKFI